MGSRECGETNAIKFRFLYKTQQQERKALTKQKVEERRSQMWEETYPLVGHIIKS